MPATAIDHEHRVTPRELFFDLVFVFAFTQVATLLANDPTFAGIGRGVLVLAALWWAWASYAWLTNVVDPEDSVVGAALLVALIAMFVAALVVPVVFDGKGCSSAPPSSSSAPCTPSSMPSRPARIPRCCAQSPDWRRGSCSAPR